MNTSKLRMGAVALVVAMLAAACSSASDKTATGGDTAGSTTPAVQQRLDRLRIHHPETLAFAAPFELIDEGGALAKVADKVERDTWTTPDVLRALIVGDKTDVVAVPTYVGANLANKGMDVKLAAVVVWGLLYVIGPDGTPASWESLRGQTIMVPFQNDMPDLVFRFLAEANGLEPGKDFKVEYYAQPPEVVARLIGGKGTWAVLPEHVATVSLAKAGQSGHKLTRVLNLQDEWAGATGGSPRIPQAGVLVPGRIAGQPAVVGALLDSLESSVAAVNEASPETVAMLAEASGLPAEMVAKIIPRLNLGVVPGADAREELERFYSELAKLSPEIIGGKLPPAEFYLADPR